MNYNSLPEMNTSSKHIYIGSIFQESIIFTAVCIFLSICLYTCLFLIIWGAIRCKRQPLRAFGSSYYFLSAIMSLYVLWVSICTLVAFTEQKIGYTVHKWLTPNIYLFSEFSEQAGNVQEFLLPIPLLVPWPSYSFRNPGIITPHKFSLPSPTLAYANDVSLVVLIFLLFIIFSAVMRMTFLHRNYKKLLLHQEMLTAITSDCIIQDSLLDGLHNIQGSIQDGRSENNLMTPLISSDSDIENSWSSKSSLKRFSVDFTSPLPAPPSLPSPILPSLTSLSSDSPVSSANSPLQPHTPPISLNKRNVALDTAILPFESLDKQFATLSTIPRSHSPSLSPSLSPVSTSNNNSLSTVGSISSDEPNISINESNVDLIPVSNTPPLITSSYSNNITPHVSTSSTGNTANNYTNITNSSLINPSNSSLSHYPSSSHFINSNINSNINSPTSPTSPTSSDTPSTSTSSSYNLYKQSYITPSHSDSYSNSQFPSQTPIPITIISNIVTSSHSHSNGSLNPHSISHSSSLTSHSNSLLNADNSLRRGRSLYRPHTPSTSRNSSPTHPHLLSQPRSLSRTKKSSSNTNLNAMYNSQFNSINPQLPSISSNQTAKTKLFDVRTPSFPSLTQLNMWMMSIPIVAAISVATVLLVPHLHLPHHYLPIFLAKARVTDMYESSIATGFLVMLAINTFLSVITIMCTINITDPFLVVYRGKTMSIIFIILNFLVPISLLISDLIYSSKWVEAIDLLFMSHSSIFTLTSSLYLLAVAIVVLIFTVFLPLYASFKPIMWAAWPSVYHLNTLEDSLSDSVIVYWMTEFFQRRNNTVLVDAMTAFMAVELFTSTLDSLMDVSCKNHGQSFQLQQSPSSNYSQSTSTHGYRLLDNPHAHPACSQCGNFPPHLKAMALSMATNIYYIIDDSISSLCKRRLMLDIQSNNVHNHSLDRYRTELIAILTNAHAEFLTSPELDAAKNAIKSQLMLRKFMVDAGMLGAVD